MNTRTDPKSDLVKRVKQWKQNQPIVLTGDKVLNVTDGEDTTEQKVEGQTAILGLANGVAEFGTLDGVIYSELPVLNEIKKILLVHGIKQAFIVGDLAGFEDGKVQPFNQTDAVIKNPQDDKSGLHWFPYQILELEGKKFSAASFKDYKKTWPQMKKIFAGSKFVHPAEISDWSDKMKKKAHRVACKFVMASNIRLFIDDMRDPSEYGLHDVIWVKNYKDAIKQLETGDVVWVSFDHDLGSEKTGYDVAKFIEKNVYDGKISYPDWQIHSANPVGRKNIETTMQSAQRWSK